MHPNFYDQLNLFVTAADLGSFSATAKTTGRAHSVVSYGISNLEDYLGVTLFDRSGHKAELTPAGRALLREAQTMVDTATTFHKTARELSLGLESHLTIAIDEIVPISMFNAALEALSSRYPGVEIRIIRTGADGAMTVVRDRRAMLGLGIDLPRPSGDLDGILLGKVSMIPVIATSLQKNAWQNHTADLSSFRQIVLSGVDEPESRPDQGVLSSKIWRVSELSTKHDLILSGFGWGMLPEHMVESSLANKSLSPLPIRQLAVPPQVPITLFFRNDTPLGPAGQLFKKSFSR